MVFLGQQGLEAPKPFICLINLFTCSRTFLFFPAGNNCHIYKLVEYSRFSLIEEKVDLVEKGEILFD